MFDREGSALHPTKFECEARAQLLNSRPFRSIEDVAMLTDKDVVTLIMESDHTTTNELWIVWKQGREHTTNGMPQSRAEVVEDQLWDMICRATMSLICVRHHLKAKGATTYGDILSHDEVGDAELHCGALREMNQCHCICRSYICE
jgi:hypothetical protein